MLLAALAVELVDELFDGAKSAALPLIRHDLSLSYVQVGLLSTIPLVVGGLLELPLGVLSGSGRRRRRFILGGGLVVILAIAATAASPAFYLLVAALTLLFPASGAFVSLTQSALMDAMPGRQAQHMAWWTMAGSAGALAGPLLVAACLGTGLTWRAAILVVAACGLLAWVATALAGQPDPSPGEAAEGGPAGASDAGADWPGWRCALAITRSSGALRWLFLLQASDLLLDVFGAFLAVYLVAEAHVSVTAAALGVGIRLGAGLAGDVMLTRLLNRVGGRRVLRASGWIALVLFPAFLLMPGFVGKMAVLAALTLSTAPWYPVLQAELYGSLPGRSGLAVSLASAAGLAGGAGPLVVGLLAQRVGLGWAMAVLCLAPACLLTIPRRTARAGTSDSARLGCRD